MSSFFSSRPTEAFGAAMRSPFILPFAAAVAGILLIAIVVIVVIRIFQNHPKSFLLGPVHLWAPKTPVLINRNELTPATRGNYTLSFYIRIDAVPDPREASPLLTWPGVWQMAYNPAHQEMICTAQQTSDGSSSEPEKTTIPNVPTQRWTQIAITWEGRTANFYINGSLEKSWSLRNLPPSAISSLTIVPEGCKGQIAYVQLWNRRLTSGDVRANYTGTSDSRGRPYLGPDILKELENLPNMFCRNGACGGGTKPSATPSQTWEFPYA